KRNRFQRVHNALAKEAVITNVALAGCSCRKQIGRGIYRLSYRLRLWTSLVICRDLQNLFDLRWRHVRLVGIVRGEVSILADDQRGNSGGIRRRHRGALHVAIGIAGRRTAWTGADLEAVRWKRRSRR